MPSQCSAPSWPLERCLHSLSRWTGNHSFSHFSTPPIANFLSPQKFILPDPSLAAALSLSFCDPFPSPSPFIADHLVAGKLTERKTGRGRQIGNIQSPPLKGSAQKVCQPSPKLPKASFPSSPCPPTQRLHLDSMPACDDVPSYMDETAHNF